MTAAANKGAGFRYWSVWLPLEEYVAFKMFTHNRKLSLCAGFRLAVKEYMAKHAHPFDLTARPGSL